MAPISPVHSTTLAPTQDGSFRGARPEDLPVEQTTADRTGREAESRPLRDREVQATIAVSDVRFDLRPGLPPHQGDPLSAARDCAVRGDRPIHEGLAVPTELERAVDHLHSDQAGVGAGAIAGLETRAGAAVSPSIVSGGFGGATGAGGGGAAQAVSAAQKAASTAARVVCIGLLPRHGKGPSSCGAQPDLASRAFAAAAWSSSIPEIR